MTSCERIRGIIVAVALSMFPSIIVAQQGIIAIDHVSCLFQADTVLVPGNLNIMLSYANNTLNKVDISNGFRVSSPDGAYWDSTTITTSPIGTFSAYFDIVFHIGHYSNDGQGADTVGILGVGTPTASLRQLPAGYTGTPVTITLWNLTEAMDHKHICVDSSFFQPGGTWKWVRVDNGTEHTFTPEFLGLPGQTYTPGSGYCFVLYHLPCAALRHSLATTGASNEPGCPCSFCCVGTTGNVNDNGIVDLSDLSALVSYLTGGGFVLPCEEEANINAAGIVDLTDLSSLVSYLTGGGYALPNCL